MKRVTINLTYFVMASMLWNCGNPANRTAQEKAIRDSLLAVQQEAARLKAEEEQERHRPRSREDIELSKDLSYDKYTLKDSYDYNGKTRIFQWEKIRDYLAKVENIQRGTYNYAVLQNHKNKNGEAALAKSFVRNAYKRVSDTLGVERYQSIPLYVVEERDAPVRYARDGSLVALHSADSLDFLHIEGLSFEGKWEVPARYLKKLGSDVQFEQVIVVDVSNQNIATFERGEKPGNWIIRSMNPATTGVHKPPYAQETPLGVFVIQEKKETMYFLKDGSHSEIAGFAPFASRFCNGGYIHGIPVNYPDKAIIDHSWSLGTVPRSHMCVRNVSSHAKFIFDWAKTLASLVIVID